jgi:hypothetical protein
MTTATDSRLDRIKTRITALLDRAEHHATPEHEATSCREKAEALMQEYRIERAMLNLEDNSKRKFEVKNLTDDLDPRLSGIGYGLRRAAYQHAKCQVANHYWNTTVVGYPEDIFYGGVLTERVFSEYLKRMYPTWDNDLDWRENVYYLKTSGMTYQEVRDAVPEQWKKGMFAGKIKWAVESWEDHLGIPHQPMTKRHDAYRNSFRDAFVSRFESRLEELRERQMREDGPGEYAVALLDDDDALKEEFYRLFPQYRPKTDEERKATWSKYFAEQEAKEKAEQERRAKLTQAQRDAEDRKKAREEEKREREWRKFEERNRKDQSGWAAGTAAADRVRLRMDDEFHTATQTQIN